MGRARRRPARRDGAAASRLLRRSQGGRRALPDRLHRSRTAALGVARRARRARGGGAGVRGCRLSRLSICIHWFFFLIALYHTACRTATLPNPPNTPTPPHCPVGRPPTVRPPRWSGARGRRAGRVRTRAWLRRPCRARLSVSSLASTRSEAAAAATAEGREGRASGGSGS